MRIDEVRQLGDNELQKALDDAHKELFNLRFQLATRKLVDHQAINRTKKTIARINTIIRERQLA